MDTPAAATWRFFTHLLRDLVGTFRLRWRRFYRRVVEGRAELAVGVDIFPFCERMTGVGWYEWHHLAALDRLDAGLTYNLYAHTFLPPEAAEAPAIPGSARMRLRTHHVPAGFLLPVAPTLLVLRAVVEPLLRILDANDIFFAPNFFLPRTQLPYAKRIAATVHDLAFSVMPETVAPATLDELHRFLPETLYHAERLIAVSDATARDLVDRLAVRSSRIHTIHEGVDPELPALAASAPAPELTQPYLLFVSTLEPRKNVVGVLRAFAHLVEWGYPGSLVLVGRWGWGTAAMEAELARHPARGRIVHLDYVERAALPGLYRAADALLFPSWMEGFGLPLLEAMACGTPVVTSGRSAMPEVAGTAAVYVDPSSPVGIATAVAALLDDPQHRARLVREGQERAARFQWSQAARATAEVLRQVGGLPRIGADEYRV